MKMNISQWNIFYAAMDIDETTQQGNKEEVEEIITK